ncbi:MAG TPA: bifunctional phosphopantothenoylcysteine decarboxylase/phosphopantothenate--cysteine ligase CoaBC [Clostridiaceae bacterium]|nr:bifunctional phosphopantothenoylcysteine decarboxylase/phosphopantothenate--cysteine ligase CoaBC [Clostridiaceae bacterium]
MLNGKKVVMGICGGIAAYKAADVVSRLKKQGAEVDVIMTRSAANFITPLTFQSLSGNHVVVDMFEKPVSWEIKHISLAKKADIFVIVSATADMIGKIANGIADDMLSTTVMATKAPVLIAPAMNTNMYENPIVQNNIDKLKKYGYLFTEPAYGRLACGDVGYGKLAAVDDIIDDISVILNDKKDYKGLTVMVTAGPTIEAIDPVRYITNHSSGKMGYAIAKCARNRGAEVILISGPTSLKPLRNVKVVNVLSNHDMYDAVMNNFDDCDIVVKAAAPADYRPLKYSSQKIKKDDDNLVLYLEKNIDILKELGERKGDKILVGFAAESQDLIKNAKDKVLKKNLDFIVANNIMSKDTGFKSDDNAVCIIDRDGGIDNIPRMSKIELADIILDKIKSLK